MKITGSNIFSTINQLQNLSEINLKDGQRVIGRIVSLTTDEAILDIAGRAIQAKIEGNPPPAGSTQTFQVSTDEQGRIILKVLQNLSETDGNAGNPNSSTKITTSPDQAFLQKNVVSALVKDNLPPTSENVEKVMKFLQEFQTKYQQTINPKVATFIMAQKWPFTPATVLASIVYQDKDLRDLLWNKLQENLPQQEAALFQEKLTTDMQGKAPQIQEKLQSVVETKLQGFLDKLTELAQAKENPSGKANPAMSYTAKLGTNPDSGSKTSVPVLKTNLPDDLAPQLFIAKAIANLKSHSEPDPISGKNRASNITSEKVQSNVKEPAPVNKGTFQNPVLSSSNKEQPVTEPKVVQNEKSNEPNQEKITSILDQNISINKAILKDTAVNGSSNLIPLLVNDDQSQIRECFIQWKEEKSGNQDNSSDQVVYMTVPTNNMGDIHLALRVGASGTRIHFRVDSDDVRKYFIQNTNDLKEFIAKNNALISVNLKENEEFAQGVSGVDLWM